MGKKYDVSGDILPLIVQPTTPPCSILLDVAVRFITYKRTQGELPLHVGGGGL